MPGLKTPTKPENPQKSFMTVKQAAERLKKDVDYVYALIENGELPCIKIPSSRGKRHFYLIDPDEFEEWLQKHKINTHDDKEEK